MPEIKNTFLQGKMNKDLDERLIPNGQYRDAVNVEVSTSEGSDVGAVKNILGNQRIENIVPPGFKCVGSIANEKTNKLYWFISSYAKDAIIEHDIINDKTDPVIVDLNAGNSKAVLKFSGNIITGINIINNLLFWTDNNSEPKKINIDECKKGTPDIDTHTQLIFDHGSFDGITLKYVARSSGTNQSYWTEPFPKIGRYFWFEQKHIEKLFPKEVDGTAFTYNRSSFSDPDLPYNIRHYRNNKFLGIKKIWIWGNHLDASGDIINESESGSHARTDPYVYAPSQNAYVPGTLLREYWPFQVGDVIFGDNIKLDIEERHITVIKPKPLKAPTVKINHVQTLDSLSNIPNLFETTFPRFSYRYKFKDGEFSAFAPFTEPVFNPKYTKDINSTSDTNVFYTKDNVYDVKDPHNKAMVNSIHSVELTDFITATTPEDAIEIEILYKQENSSVIYSINTIKQTDPEWHDWSNHENTNIGLGKAINGSDGDPANAYSFSAIGSYNKGKYTVTTENIHAALPANQLLRPWDNVPRKALGQEITGNRIVYGNYLQNYNLGNIKPEIKVGYNDRNNQLGTFENKGLPSIKSQRNYQLGIIYCDKYGRETPVFTSSGGAVNIPWQKADGTKNASKSLQLNASIVSSFPEWVDSFKVFVKETSSPYYNLVMDRAWVAKSTYELDRGEHLWISFPSSDRNKISEEDYIVLKKKIGTGEEQIAFENKFKVIDVKNEAPDAIKYELVNYGSVSNTNGTALTSVLGSGFLSERIDTETNLIRINHSAWSSALNIPLVDMTDNNSVSSSAEDILKDLYVSWRRLSGGLGVSSKKYKITGGIVGSTNYILTLSTPITKIDADIAHVNSDSSAGNTGLDLHADLVFQIEKREIKDSEDFSGKFFVKISKNQVTDLIEEGSTTDVLDNYIVSAKTPTWYWQDVDGTDIRINEENGYGLSNYNGFSQSYSAQNNIQSAAQNAVGNDHPLAASGLYTTTLKLTDYAAAWDGIKLNPDFGNTFFIDSMHMVAGQSEASNYAKYCCVTWAGCTKDENESQEISSWSYPPFKMWLTDWIDSENVIENLDEEDEQARFHDAIESGLIDTSPVNVADDDFKLLTSDTEGVKVTGWVGSNQVVDRHVPTPGSIGWNHVNGLEGLVTTVEDHSIGPRRWLSGTTNSSTEHGVGIDTKTYSDNGEIGRHFMHLSFFAPGKNLHSGTWDGLGAAGARFYGAGSWAANLEGIWGGGVFTGGNSKHQGLLSQNRFGDDLPTGIGYAALPMEGNHDSTNGWLPETPGPGVGYGYDTSKNYQELHERQWDPTFTLNGDPENKIRDFIRNLHAGSQFKFSGDTTNEIYTIKKVVVKKLYNHTSWRTPFNRYQDTTRYHSSLEDILYQSVEEAGLSWLNQLNDSGQNTGINQVVSNFQGKIVDFGKASNRRLCYIIELDKNPTQQSFNPLQTGTGVAMTADTTDDEFANIEFLEKVQSTLLAGLNKFPAIWETDPKRQEVNLDIYYEASNNFPISLSEETNELIAPVGCKVEMLGASQVSGLISSSYKTGISNLMSWDGTTATLEPGFPIGDDTIEIEYSGIPFKFTKEDGSFIVLTADEQQLLGQSTSSTEFKTDFVFRYDLGDSIRVGLGWHNCFSFGNGLESNRIRDDFNEMYIGNGVKASTTTQQIYEEEHRAHGLIYSGLYNSNSGVNDLNQFIMAEKVTKDLNPSFGSIQKLFQRRISLIAFCEDKVVSITSNKDALYNADGNPQLVSSNAVLGDANPFQGNFGISKNPESFASESYRAYFTDKQRGVVIRLSKDGLTPISKTGMQDWFRDNLQNYSSLIGSYDGYKEDYNVTLTHKFGENFIYNSFLGEGVELSTQQGSLYNHIINSGVNDPGPSGDFQYAYNMPLNRNDINGTLVGDFIWGPENEGLDSLVEITNHAAIAFESIQQAQPYIGPNTIDPNAPAATYGTYTTIVTTSTGTSFAGGVYSYSAATSVGGGYITSTSSAPTGPGTTVGTTGITTTTQYQAGAAFVQATYGSAGGSLVDDGWWYDPRFTSVSDDLWGANPTHLADAQVYSTIRRKIAGTSVVESANISYPNSALSTHNASVEKPIFYPLSNLASSNWDFGNISQAITRNDGTEDGINKTITFDRPDPTDTYVEFKNIGSNGTPSGAGINETYVTNSTSAQLAESNQLYGGSDTPEHDSFYNGDEIHIQFELTCFVTMDASGGDAAKAAYGYNFIMPKIQLYDGGALVDSTFLKVYDGFGIPFGGFQATQDANGGVYNPYAYQQTGPGDMGGDFAPPTGIAAIPTSYSFQSQEYRAIGDAATSSASVTFPDTQTIGALLSSSTSDAGTKTIVVGASFKFIDPNQQNPNGTAIISGTDITEVKVINDLRIRIRNDHPKHDADYNYPDSAGNLLLRQQLWEVNKLFIKKGFGVVAPHEDPQAATPGVFTQATTTFTAGVPPTYLTPQAQWDSIPPANVPAWAEVEHSSNFGWTLQGMYGTTSATILSVQSTSNYGPTFLPLTVSYTTGTGITGSYQTPNNYPGVTTGNPNVSFNQYADNSYPIIDNYLHVETNAASAIDLTWNIATTPWVTDGWYLVDVEFDESVNSNTGNTGMNGSIHVFGVVDLVAGSGPINPEGVGEMSGSAAGGAKHCRLIQVLRTEYGNEETVLRGLFKVDSGSYVDNNNPLGNSYSTPKNEFRLRFYEFQNPGAITKVIVKKMDVAASGGTAASWTHASDVLTHSFSKKKLYYKNGKLNWDLEAPGDSNKFWGQTFPSNSLAPTPAGYTLKFTIGDNPDTNDHFGNLRLFCNNDIHDTKGFEGMYYTGITDPGEYEINFNFTQDSTEISTGTPWSIYRYVWNANLNPPKYEWQPYTTATFQNSSSISSWDAAGEGNQIRFMQMYGLSDAFRMSISNLSLIDNTLIFQGGTSGSWNWNGFFTSLESYISWDYDNGRIQFGELDPSDSTVVITPCPFVDPASTAAIKVPINANQWVDRTINRYETYNIEFVHGITQGRLDIYYFNSEGYGFRIKEIAPFTGDLVSSNPDDGRIHTVQVMIGAEGDGNMSEKRSASHPAGQIYQPELKETFVITPSMPNAPIYTENLDNNEVAGWVDNITMTRVYNIELDENDEPIFEEKTVTFSEDVNGWTSFKSFVPESGVSLSKKYFTFDEGGLFKHYVPLAYNKADQEWIDSTVKDAENYNIFYGDYGTDTNTGDVLVSSDAESKIKFVLNSEPSMVKMFNTLNYEGTQTHVKKPGHVDYVTASNAIAWTKDMDIQGWQCMEIKTDLDAGSVIEFIKKEGKWFNYIKGKSTQDLDTSRFSVQGIGISDTVNL